ncbi:hypothetical protein [Desulfobacter postgatei]|nr:hypothetical protein [Desulfobacter postgatei]
MGQGLVFLVLVTPKITIPIGYAFHVPDPKISEWVKENKRLKKAGVPKSKRPKKPVRSDEYPTISSISIALLKTFVQQHPEIKIEAIVADALYGNAEFMDEASKIAGSAQVISQIRYNQNISFKNSKKSVEKYFENIQPIQKTIHIRGGKGVVVLIKSARIHVCAHRKKRFVIAIKYTGEEDYRYLVASDLTWRYADIIDAFTR